MPSSLASKIAHCEKQRKLVEYLDMNDSSGTASLPKGYRPRRSRREAIQAEVAYKKAGQLRYPVRLFDLSQTGCKIEFVERLRVGDRILIKLAGLEGLPASVCWIEGFVGGVEFERPLHPAVFERLIAQLR